MVLSTVHCHRPSLTVHCLPPTVKCPQFLVLFPVQCPLLTAVHCPPSSCPCPRCPRPTRCCPTPTRSGSTTCTGRARAWASSAPSTWRTSAQSAGGMEISKMIQCYTTFHRLFGALISKAGIPVPTEITQKVLTAAQVCSYLARLQIL